MATYIPNVTDYIPQIQEFKPDYNFYNKALQMRQSKYDAAHEQLSTLYGSLLNSPMLREKNVAERDQFFKVIDQDIKKMSSLDLSKQQNVQAASTIFNQMLDNKSIVKDMTWTRNWQKQHQKLDAMRNCVDPEKCGGSWWQGGVDYLNYQAEDFKNATDDEAMNFGNARYVASQNITDMAMKVAKDLDLNIKVDTRKGGFIVTTKNGLNAVQPLYALLSGKIGNDPKVLDYLDAKNYLNRKNWIKSNIPTYGSEEAATNEYVKQRALELKDTLKKHQINIDFKNDNIKQEIRNFEEKVAEGVPLDKKGLSDIYSELTRTQSDIEESSSFIKDANDHYKQAEVNNFSKATLRSLDKAGVLSDLEKELGAAAQTLAFKDYEQTIKVDPYALESVKQANRKSLEIDKYYLQVGLQREQFKIDMLEKQYEATGTLLENQVIKLPADGSLTEQDINTNDDAGWEYLRKETEKNEIGLSQAESSMLDGFFNVTLKESKNKGGLANEDLINFVDATMNALGKSTNTKERIPEELKAQIANWNKLQGSEKLAAARNFNISNLSYLRGSIIDEIYDENVAPIMQNMSKSNNRVNRSHLINLYNNSASELMNIDFKDTYLNSLNKINEEIATYTKEQIKLNDESGEFKDYVDLFIDERGVPLSVEQFSKNYMINLLKEGFSKDDIKNSYQSIKEEAADIYDDYSEEVYNAYARYYNKYIEKSPGTLQGFGSQTISGKDYMPITDPSLPSSIPTQNANTFFNSYLKASAEDVRVVMGSMPDEVPEETDAETQQLLNYLINNFQMGTDKKDKSRPVLALTYSDIAGGNRNWNALNVKFNRAFVEANKGSENLPGLTRDQYTALMTDGVTVLTNKEKVTNTFSEQANKTDLEKLLELNKEGYEFKSPYTKDLLLTQRGSNDYVVNGKIAVANSETGETSWRGIAPFYGNDANILYAQMLQNLNSITRDNDDAMVYYNKNKGNDSQQ
jgi:hypothetical protein